MHRRLPVEVAWQDGVRLLEHPPGRTVEEGDGWRLTGIAIEPGGSVELRVAADV